jgi:hypothetical protein
MPRIRLGAREDVRNDVALGIGVVLDMLPLSPRQCQFGARVQIAIGGMAAKAVPEL